jgi:hypothetical protein
MQLYVEQLVSAGVTKVYPISDEVYLFLDPSKRTTIVELTGESIGGILGSANSGVAYGVAENALTELRLFFHDERRQEWFYAPSHVASPEIADAIGAGLRVRQIGISSTGGGTFSAGRIIAAHAYIDQID